MENKSDWSWTQFLDSGSQPDERVVAWVANIFVQGQKVDEAQKWQPRWWDGRLRIFPSLHSLKQRLLVCRNWPFSQMIPNCWQVTVGPHFAQPVRQHGAMLVQQSGAKFFPMDFGVPRPFEESQRLQWSSQNNLKVHSLTWPVNYVGETGVIICTTAYAELMSWYRIPVFQP